MKDLISSLPEAWHSRAAVIELIIAAYFILHTIVAIIQLGKNMRPQGAEVFLGSIAGLLIGASLLEGQGHAIMLVGASLTAVIYMFNNMCNWQFMPCLRDNAHWVGLTLSIIVAAVCIALVAEKVISPWWITVGLIICFYLCWDLIKNLNRSGKQEEQVVASSSTPPTA